MIKRSSRTAEAARIEHVGGTGVARYARLASNGRKYAQHEMLAHQDECWELIGRGAEIFVCGNARTLAPGVRAALQQIHAAKTGSTSDEAASWLAGLRREHRYLEDIWGAN